MPGDLQQKTEVTHAECQPERNEPGMVTGTVGPGGPRQEPRERGWALEVGFIYPALLPNSCGTCSDGSGVAS